MQHKKGFMIIMVLIHLLSYLSFLFLNSLNFAFCLSYEIAFFSILLIIIVSYFNYKKTILTRAKKYETKPLMIFLKNFKNLPKIIKFKDLNDDLIFKDKMRYFALFFALFKILAYGILVAGFLFLRYQNLLEIFGYLCGISALLICIFIFTLYIKYES